MGKVNPYKVYGDLIFSWITKGQTEKVIDLPNDSIDIGFNRTISQDYCSYYFQLRSFGDLSDYEMFANFRRSAKRRYTKKMFIDIITRSRPYSVNWKSRNLQDSQRVWISNRKAAKKNKRKSDSEGYSSGTEDYVMSLEEKKEYSWRYFQDAEQRGESAMLYSLVIRVKVPKSDSIYVDDLFDAVANAAKSQGMLLEELKICLSDYINEISPFKHESTKFASSLIAERAETTGVVTKLYSTDQNRLPQNKVKLGNDVYNKKIVSLDIVKELPSGASMFLVGETGSGKSVVLKNLIEELKANKFHVYLCDYERTEYTALGEQYGATFLDFGGGTGYYYEPLQLCEPTGIEGIDMDIYPTAISNFYAYVNIFNGKKITATQELILSEAINKVYSSYDVDPKDTSTWVNAKNIRMKDVQKFVSMERYSSEAIKKYGDDLRKIADVLELAFSENSVRGYLMRNPISLDELRDAEIIIYRFGKDSKGGLVDGEDLEIAISQLSKMILDQQLARVRRSRKEKFCVVYEEVQRYIKHAGSYESLNTTYTGVRKANGFAISVLNDPKLLTEELSSLVNNSKYLIVGKTNDLNLLKPLFKTPSLSGCEKLIAKLSTIKNAFFIKTPEFQSIFRVELPQYMIDGPIYKTVDVEDSK